MSGTAAPTTDIAGNAAAEARLLDRLEGWAAADGDPAAPSRLPGWTVGHVLTHLARNADGMRAMAEGSAVGEARAMYPSAEARSAAIEAGAARGAAELVEDVRSAAAALGAAWEHVDWAGSGVALSGTVAAVEFPFRRWREVEVHHVDLGLGYEATDWPSTFVRPELRRQEMTAKSRMPMGMTMWPPAVLALPDAVRLAWLFGRHESADLPEITSWS